jgi:hypothetical protein
VCVCVYGVCVCVYSVCVCVCPHASDVFFCLPPPDTGRKNQTGGGNEPDTYLDTLISARGAGSWVYVCVC